jgi:hypothetical protein
MSANAQTRRMLLSAWDLSTAAEYASLLIDLLKQRSVERGVPQQLINALHTALIVTYARPFSGNRSDGQTAATVSLRTLFKMSAEQRLLHRMLLDQRNRAVAHSDPSTWQLEFREELGKMVPVVMHPIASPTVADLESIRDLCRSAAEALSKHLAKCGYTKRVIEQTVG